MAAPLQNFISVFFPQGCSQNILNCQMINYLNVNNHLSSSDRLLVSPRASPKFNLLLMVLLPIPPLPFLIIAANSPKSICPSCDTKLSLVQSWKPRKRDSALPHQSCMMSSIERERELFIGFFT